MTDVRDGPVIGMRQIGAKAGYDFNSTIDYISRRLLDAIGIWLDSDDISRMRCNDKLKLLNLRYGQPFLVLNSSFIYNWLLFNTLRVDIW